MDADRLERKAHEYALNRVAAEERGDKEMAMTWAIVELVLRELIDVALDDEREAA